MSAFTARYDPRTQTVTLTHALGLLFIATTILLATYETRQQQWPGVYPAVVGVAGECPF